MVHNICTSASITISPTSLLGHFISNLLLSTRSVSSKARSKVRSSNDVGVIIIKMIITLNQIHLLCSLLCSVPYLIDEFQVDRVFVHLYQFPCFLVPSILSYDHIVHTLSTFEIVAYQLFLNEYLICL